ncbi:Transposon TX1 uncharacterized 149 kDa protein [Vitis vinifera]|uniref:Transposon TX1 uncharacterized 149 kDa protein n=1 Tax=Vitis vinifera TaxID=29760 RepID=A0A438G2P4_VITVI|nr:Transposon TX1 uncharacterized 149 kDa protein [Vitis vinifera]
MTIGLVRSLRVGRHLDWSAVNSRGAARGILCAEGNRGLLGKAWGNKRLMKRPLGSAFTWRGGLNNQSQSKLDPFLVIDNWDSLFDGSVQGVLPKSVLDHFPILLDGGGMRRRPSPFRFENMWVEGFKGQVKNWWAKQGEALNQVMYWDEKEKVSALNLEEYEARKEARESYKTWILREKISWRQKLREVRLKKGDNNTRFFHRMANAHSRRNRLSKVKVNGNNEVERLELPFLEEEVFAALSDLSKDKAPGGRFVKSLNAAFLVLVPKKGGAEDLKDFRLISLVGSLYKLLAKVLANRLKKVMVKVILESQNAFVEGRQILDIVLIANEVMDSMLKNNAGSVLCKLHIKEYDHVNWKFLISVLRKMTFGKKWIKWFKGLRQGDPLSPYLFVIVMEVFSCLLRRAISGGYLSGWRRLKTDDLSKLVSYVV